MTKSQFNTIYIISKGRPNCTTAKTLTKLNYPGQWFIVCGTNDTKLQEYIETWGKERILIFDWHEQIKDTDTLDNFGFEKMPSGAVPVRNATFKISQGREELRHWQFDDDYNNFRVFRPSQNKYVNVTGQQLEDVLFEIAKFGYNAKARNCGFALASETFPNVAFQVGSRVFNAHNMPSTDDLFMKWRGRMNDDLINAMEVSQLGGREFSFKFLSLTMAPSQSEQGGLTDIYKDEGTVRKTAYAVVIAPNAVKLVIKFGRYHHSVNWNKLKVKIISPKYVKV